MYRTLFKFVVVTITILTANLITTHISDYLTGYKNHLRPVSFTLLYMGIIVLVFYPLFMKLEEWLNALSVILLKSGRSLGGKYTGLLLIFIVCISVLTWFYAKQWYHTDLLKALFNGTISDLW